MRSLIHSQLKYNKKLTSLKDKYANGDHVVYCPIQPRTAPNEVYCKRDYKFRSKVDTGRNYEFYHFTISIVLIHIV